MFGTMVLKLYCGTLEGLAQRNIRGRHYIVSLDRSGFPRDFWGKEKKLSGIISSEKIFNRPKCRENYEATQTVWENV